MNKLHELINEAADEFEKDYKVEWERKRLESLKLAEENKNNDENLISEGKPVPLITEISASREITDVYLKHPGEEEEEDSEEGEEVGVGESEEVEDESFVQFVDKHKKKASEKMQLNK